HHLRTLLRVERIGDGTGNDAPRRRAGRRRRVGRSVKRPTPRRLLPCAERVTRRFLAEDATRAKNGRARVSGCQKRVKTSHPRRRFLTLRKPAVARRKPSRPTSAPPP